MAIPVGSVARVFRDPKGRFISRAKHELLSRISKITGRFLTAEAALTERTIEARLRKKLGRPPAGQQWLALATKYSERFADILSSVT